MSPKWCQRGSPNGAKIIKKEVLEASCFKGGSQMASRAPPGSILERFWNHFGTILVSFSNIVLVMFACILDAPNRRPGLARNRNFEYVGPFWNSFRQFVSNVLCVIWARIIWQHVINKTFKITRSHQENAAESFQETSSLFVPSCIEKLTIVR